MYKLRRIHKTNFCKNVIALTFKIFSHDMSLQNLYTYIHSPIPIKIERNV